MTIVRPDQNSGGGGGGGGIASWGLASQSTFSGSGSPSGVVTPNAAGDLYLDKTTPGLWQANGVTNTSWQLIGLEQGNAFPGSPTNGQWFYRNDRNVLYFWNNSVSRWLTVDLKYVPFSQAGVLNSGQTTAGQNLGGIVIAEDIFVEKWMTQTFVVTTNNGTNFWTVAFQKTSPANVQTSITTFDTSADTASTWTSHVVAVNALILASGFSLLQFSNTVKTSTPGNLFIVSQVTLRIAG